MLQCMDFYIFDWCKIDLVHIHWIRYIQVYNLEQRLTYPVNNYTQHDYLILDRYYSSHMEMVDMDFQFE